MRLRKETIVRVETQQLSVIRPAGSQSSSGASSVRATFRWSVKMQPNFCQMPTRCLSLAERGEAHFVEAGAGELADVRSIYGATESFGNAAPQGSDLKRILKEMRCEQKTY